MIYKNINKVDVSISLGGQNIPVGILATDDNKLYFQYHGEFVSMGIEISPYKLPLDTRLKQFERTEFDGLIGVFNDSLPDGWGRLLFERSLRSKGILPSEITVLDRLASVGNNAMGALIYSPDKSEEISKDLIDLDTLSSQSNDILNGSSDEVLQQLLQLNGSSAGARPKAIISVNENFTNITHRNIDNGQDSWIVKFTNSMDGKDSGAIEYVYSLMAKDAGINMTNCHLFDSNQCSGYFATKRFDRDGEMRKHMHSVCGLIHSDFRTPTLDYKDLLTLTAGLTKDVREVEKMFRLAVFNVMAHNRDDHSKNFSFIMDERGSWKLSPAYDITFSSGPNSEQSTMVAGEGKNPSEENLLNLVNDISITTEKANQIIDQTKQSLSKWKELAKEYGVSNTNIKNINDRILN